MLIRGSFHKTFWMSVATLVVVAILLLSSGAPVGLPQSKPDSASAERTLEAEFIALGLPADTSIAGIKATNFTCMNRVWSGPDRFYSLQSKRTPDELEAYFKGATHDHGWVRDETFESGANQMEQSSYTKNVNEETIFMNVDFYGTPNNQIYLWWPDAGRCWSLIQ